MYLMNVPIFKALGNEARLQIIQTLMVKEHNVTDLTAVSGKNQTTISRHLANLVNAKIISQKKIGRNVFYSIINPRMKEWLESTIDIKVKSDGNKELSNKIMRFLNQQRDTEND
ncbi:MAG: hypothetical protein CMD14_08865 [Flavobacteriales bacterium]|nr:hypothetical protein [Flavobacteriales bacterium]